MQVPNARHGTHGGPVNTNNQRTIISHSFATYSCSGRKTRVSSVSAEILEKSKQTVYRHDCIWQKWVLNPQAYTVVWTNNVGSLGWLVGKVISRRDGGDHK
jgi:hypothetical protein